jgi:SpoVK/Ycf46/Vps4 family AAA+-type ATPase
LDQSNENSENRDRSDEHSETRDLSDENLKNQEPVNQETESVSRMISKMIHTSQLDPIIAIRRDESTVKELKRELRSLIRETKLDPEQLQSLLGSLTSPVHLTQGPPGTGKSYLGVVIIRALLIIRSFWIKLHPEIGNPSILVYYIFLLFLMNLHTY